MTKWCNNCEIYRSEWSSGYKPSSRCWNCDKWTLVGSDAKNLYEWWGNDISGDQKDKIAKFGVSTSSSSNQKYPSWTLTKLYYYDIIWERNKIFIPKKNQFMVFFSTWWNNNCVLTVNGDDNYAVNLLVYEMPSREMKEILKEFYVEGGYSSLYSAKNKVKEVETTLKGENPILYKGINREIDYPPYNDKSSGGFFLSFWSFFGRRNHLSSVFSEVKSTTLHYSDDEEDKLPFSYSGSSFLGNFASSSSKFFEYSKVSHLLTSKYREFLNTDPDNFIKPLDIIKTSKDKTIHTGIYLGKRKVAHNLGNGIEIANWKDFGVRVGNPNKMTRYHPIIPFKKPEKIIEHIAKCVVNSSWRFDIIKNNCEHFANKCIYSINISEHMEMKKNPEQNYTRKQLNGSPSMSSEINRTDNTLDDSVSYRPQSKIDKINNYKVYHPQGIDMECSIEVSPRYSYWYHNEN
ncbi:lecithin retinol acyltransferase family protein [endosymbiont GvMRE of Glomus versiforme]|uniref:lecithin retinol acyltransferase family protein n=1 Tax=endosymbiont GvMRE of Glomus versiforme TaxID=2039283 RepID=UPI000EBA249D|nr:lecithin retinol acyltransferase family protein [endosymbiont GvMRE of Glomus versiforme]RHZ35421.1 NC domain protein [endosymbiont GvMRE of Glomus versiforme]